MNKIQYEMKSTIGPLYLVASKNGLEGIFWSKQVVKSAKTLDRSNPAEKILQDAQKQLEEYFSGQRKQFNLILNLSGTPFQKKVWKELGRIPFGKTASYGDIARRIQNPKAVRAVGTANKKNPVCIVIPCHRVITSGGAIGGYASGIDIKRRLLDFEQN